MKARVVATLLFIVPLATSPAAQQPESIPSLLLRFDNEHDYAQKERLLLSLTTQFPGAGPALMRLAQSTKNTDTRWMAMRGMATIHYTAGGPFLKASLKNSDWAVRANAARALGDLRITNAANALLAMFAAEREPGVVEQASLALHMLNAKEAAPYIREKVARFTGQTRSWLLQALGGVGSDSDVPFIAGYLEGSDPESVMAASAAAYALEELTGAVAVGAPNSGTDPVELGAGIAAGGAGLGVVPGNAPGIKGATGLLQDAVVKGGVQELNTLLSTSAAQLSTEALENWAFGIGVAKMGIDTVVYAWGYYGCK